MIKFPSKIDILGQKYAVVWKKNAWEVERNNDERLYGQIRFREREIWMLNGRGSREKFETILHESLHGIGERLNIKPLLEDELLTEHLTVALSELLFRNGFIKE